MLLSFYKGVYAFANRYSTTSGLTGSHCHGCICAIRFELNAKLKSKINNDFSIVTCRHYCYTRNLSFLKKTQVPVKTNVKGILSCLAIYSTKGCIVCSLTFAYN